MANIGIATHMINDHRQVVYEVTAQNLHFTSPKANSLKEIIAMKGMQPVHKVVEEIQ